MATYMINTTRKQEAGLKFSYDHYADKTVYLTQEAWLQHNVDYAVTDPMYVLQQQASSRSFDESFKTVPEAEQPATQAEIEASITAHGGTVVPPGPVTAPIAQQPPPLPPARG